MAPVTRRTDDMLIVRGVNVYPRQVGEALAALHGRPPRYVIVLEEREGLDELEVLVELGEDVLSDVMADVVGYQRRVAERLQEALGVRAAVRLVEPGSISGPAAGEGVVLDRRPRDGD